MLVAVLGVEEPRLVEAPGVHVQVDAAEQPGQAGLLTGPHQPEVVVARDDVHLDARGEATPQREHDGRVPPGDPVEPGHGISGGRGQLERVAEQHQVRRPVVVPEGVQEPGQGERGPVPRSRAVVEVQVAEEEPRGGHVSSPHNRGRDGEASTPRDSAAQRGARNRSPAGSPARRTSSFRRPRSPPAAASPPARGWTAPRARRARHGPRRMIRSARLPAGAADDAFDDVRSVRGPAGRARRRGASVRARVAAGQPDQVAGQAASRRSTPVGPARRPRPGPGRPCWS